MALIVKNGRVIDPLTKLDEVLDIKCEGERIISIAQSIESSDGDEVIDASGYLVLPGLIDMHVHFREPGREDVETNLGGAMVAAKSGFTSVCTMPNTTPVIDNQALVKFIKMESEKGPINIFPIAKITKGGLGEEITEMGELIKAGAVAFSDDGTTVMNPLVMRRALEYSKMFNVPLLCHSEDEFLADGGSMNEGEVSIRLGIKGIPNESEEVIVGRDIILARLTGGRSHVCHLSSAGSAELVEFGKERGINITCETAPHYFALNDSAVEEHLSMAKMNPPLRSEENRLKIIEYLRKGIIDAIATDHAPHSLHEKNQEINYAPFGIVGLETSVPLILTELVRNNGFSYFDAFDKVTCNPARILGIDRGNLSQGGYADITIIDPDEEVEINEEFFVSKCKNSPFIGLKLYGAVKNTICNGRVVYDSKTGKIG